MNIAYIPARGGSKSIPLKNIKPIAGKPLIFWAAKAACECKDIDTVFVSTDSAEIYDVASQFDFGKLRIVDRSAKSATDTATTEYGMLEFAQSFDFTQIALIQATSPLISSADLSNGFALLSRDNVDSVLSVVEQKRFIWEETKNGYSIPVNYDFMRRPRRQGHQGFLVENGAFYITGRNALLRSKCRISGNIKTVLMPPESYIELDEPEDWLIVEELLKKRTLSELPIIKMFLTDCDGTLTDAGMYYSSDGEIMKKFNTHDGAGLRMLRERGVITGIITGEVSESVRRRAEKIGVDELLMGVSDKYAAIQELCVKHGVDKRNVAFIGDDINDMKAIEEVGFGVSVGDALEEVKRAANYVTTAHGGEGAVREAADLVLKRIEYA